MTDEEFLDYCRSHCRTERAGFVKQNLDRLMDLAGESRLEGVVEGAIYSCYEGQIDPLVNQAKARLGIEE